MNEPLFGPLAHKDLILYYPFSDFKIIVINRNFTINCMLVTIQLSWWGCKREVWLSQKCFWANLRVFTCTMFLHKKNAFSK